MKPGLLRCNEKMLHLMLRSKIAAINLHFVRRSKYPCTIAASPSKL